MNQFVDKITNSKFMLGVQKVSEFFGTNQTLRGMAVGMQSTMALILVGAISQVLCALGGMFFGWTAGDTWYDILNLPYAMTMGILSLYMSFSIARAYAKDLDMNELQAGFMSMVCFLMVVSPVQSVTNAAGDTFMALNADAIGTGGMFVAIIIGLCSVRITKFAIDHHWALTLPPTIPAGILGAFNNVIPFVLNIVVWYGISIAITFATGGAYTLATIITHILSFPIQYLISPVGVVVLVVLALFFWFFGIHGTSMMMSFLMIPMIQAYATNAELAAAGQPLIFDPVFVYMVGIGCIGGAGNTLPLVVMGLRSKSEQIRTLSRTALIPGVFGINEPVIFGMPIMYNATFFIPFIFGPLVVMFFYWLGIITGILAAPQVMIFAMMPVGITEFLSTLSWTNALFPFVMFPLVYLIWLPFFKIYEKEMIAQEEALAAQEAAEAAK